MINLKANKNNNNAIAALSQLYKDYLLPNGKEKLFLIFKTNYYIKNKMINIKNTKSFFFEQCDFSLIKTDNRSWSKKNDNLSGRIQYNPEIKNLISISKISYDNTKENLINWVNLKRNKKQK